MKPLCLSAKMRLFRQSEKTIAALERRLATCAIEDAPKLMAALNAEREAQKAFLK